MQSTEFYQKHLDGVSRSFAFCIARLDKPMRLWVSSAYLICRIVDTIEDTDWSNLDQQLMQFDLFNHALSKPDTLYNIQDWADHFPTHISASERALIKDAHLIFADFHEFPEDVREAMAPLILSMSDGMRYFCERKTAGVLRLMNIADVNRYCFFVAGIVGEILTRLLMVIDPNLESQKHDLILKAHQFGLFLQKINILKDQMNDEKEGRFFLPSRTAVLESAKMDAHIALDYVMAIPSEHRDFRLFCSWSLFLGLASLPFIEESFKERKPLKITREQSMHLFEEVESWIDDNHKLRTQFEELLPSCHSHDWEIAGLSEVQGSKWVKKIYRGELQEPDLDFLGLYTH